MNFTLYFIRKAKLTYPKSLRNFRNWHLSISILKLCLLDRNFATAW